MEGQLIDYTARIGDLLRRVRGRWRRLRVSKAIVRAALTASAALAAAFVLSRFLDRAPLALVALAIVTLAVIVAGALRAAGPLRVAPDDSRVARFVEERVPELDDRLASAVDAIRTDRHRSAPGLVEPMLADTARRADAIDLDAVLPGERLRRAGFQAAAACLLCAALMVAVRRPARQAFDAASLLLFPGRVTLEVAPGNARVKAGTPLAVDARLVGNRAPVLARLEIGGGETPRVVEMTGSDGAFHADLGQARTTFTYRVIAGAVRSPEFTLAVAHAPRVARIDVDYHFPPGLGLEARTDPDSGDIYAPAGTDVRLTVHTDRPAATGRMAFGDGKTIDLAPESTTSFTTAFKVVDDNSYRIALADRDGVANPGDTEYFVRMLADRPPDVRVLKPAADRAVTRLEEVDIEAQADDDYGIDRMDLVYSLRGEAEKVVPLAVPRRATSAKAGHTLFLEDLDVQPGDFISYYVRARDVARGARANEARSDIFFLEVKPFEQEFSLAQSASMNGGGGGSIDDLVTAQKEIVVATWKLDRRARVAHGGLSEADVRSVSRAESELKGRVERASSSFRESTMRDPRRRTPPPGVPPPGQAMPEEDAMGLAAAAMGTAVTALDALKTGNALPPEMEALNHLLKAQADVKKRQVTRQQASNGSGDNNRNYDLSSLFDRELKKQQQTNYENRSSTEQRDDSAQAALDRIRELARRQDELLKRQQELANRRETMSGEELKRQLDTLTREQSELRQQAEELARQMNAQEQSQSRDQSGRKSGQQAGSSSASSGASGGGETSRQMRDVSEEMRGAAGDLRRQDPSQASARGARALEKLRGLEQRLGTSTPEQQRRALGNMQLEARQLADAERQLAAQSGRLPSGDPGKDAARRLAAEQERIAGRTRQLQEGLKQQSASQQAAAGRPAPDGRDGGPGGRGAKPEDLKRSAADAAREMERQQIPDRMQKSADAMRSGTPDGKRETEAQQEMARSLDRVAERLGSATGAQSGDARKLSDRLARAQDLKDRMARLSKQIEEAGRQNGRGSQSASSQKAQGSDGRAGAGQSGSGGRGGDLAELRQQYERELKETRDLLDEMKREDPGAYSRGGGVGFTYEGQGMTLSAPGTEAFKQDFSRWEDLRRQATQALDLAETTLSKKLQAAEARDRLAAGADDRPPAEYQKQVDQYFKTIAKKK